MAYLKITRITKSVFPFWLTLATWFGIQVLSITCEERPLKVFSPFISFKPVPRNFITLFLFPSDPVLPKIHLDVQMAGSHSFPSLPYHSSWVQTLSFWNSEKNERFLILWCRKMFLRVLWKQVFQSTPFKVQLIADDIMLSVAVTCYVF